MEPIFPQRRLGESDTSASTGVGSLYTGLISAEIVADRN
jgi:hypothetical protein